MRRTGLFTLLLFAFSVHALAWQHIRTDSIPDKNLLAFPFAVRSLETNWGFGAKHSNAFTVQLREAF
jgi:hypothetical protein